jgi:hypothetical protein
LQCFPNWLEAVRPDDSYDQMHVPNLQFSQFMSSLRRIGLDAMLPYVEPAKPGLAFRFDAKIPRVWQQAERIHHGKRYRERASRDNQDAEELSEQHLTAASIEQSGDGRSVDGAGWTWHAVFAASE